jgi:hypothetical protein
MKLITTEISGSEHMCVGVLGFVSMNTSNVTYYSRSSVDNSAVTTCPISFKFHVIGLNKFLTRNLILILFGWYEEPLYFYQHELYFLQTAIEETKT